MNSEVQKYYPTILKAIHLIVLYMFIEAIVEFPLALYDYYNGTDYLYNPLKKIILGVGTPVFIFYYAYRKAGVSLKELFPLKKFNPLLLVPIMLFLWGAQNLIGEVNIVIDKVLPAPSWFGELFNKIFESDFGIYGAFLKVSVIAPVIEEMIFRGVIMHGFTRNYSHKTAIIVSALMFALYHLNPWQFPATFVLGLLLGFLKVRTNSLLLCILGHSINNSIVLFSLIFSNQLQGLTFFNGSKASQLIISCIVAAVSFVFIHVITSNRGKEAN